MKTIAIHIPMQLFKRNNILSITPRDRALNTVNWFLNGMVMLHHQTVINQKNS